MIEGWKADTEQHIREAAVLPRLPVQLRTRVLATVRQAQRRRMWRNGLLSAAALLVSVTGLGAWTSCRWNADCAEATPAASHEHQTAPAEAIHSGMSGIGQWDHVEAEQRKREEDRARFNR